MSANPTAGMPPIVTTDLWRVYRLGSQEVPALRGVNLTVHTGQFVALKGRSGSGKTTLLNCLAGLDQPTSGSVTVLGEELTRLDDRQMTLWRRTRIGLVFQSFSLLPMLSAHENVEMILRILRVPRAERHSRTIACLDLVGLGKWAGYRPYEMSGGQQQRVAIARALANRPGLILADEPTAELDSATAREILGLFRQIVHEAGLTLLMVSHDGLVDEYADQILTLHDGQVTAGQVTAG